MARRNPSLLIVGNPPETISREVHYIGYRHAEDGLDYKHEFSPGVEMHAEKDGALTLLNPTREVWDDFGGQRFLVNPPKKRGKTMARRLPPRHRSGPNKGRFKKRARSSKRRRRRNQPPAVAAKAAPRRRNQPARRAAPRPRARRAPPAPTRRPRRRNRNPARKITVRRVLRDIQDGAVNAAYILVGKAAARTIHTVTGLPKMGNTGLAVQALSAVVAGMIADAVIGASRAKFVLAGGLTAPLETAIVAFNVPFLAQALSPAAAINDLQGYRNMGRYAQPIAAPNGLNRYVAAGAGLAGYVSPTQALEMGNGYDYAGCGAG